MIEVECPHCTTRFEVPDSMRGGHANCAGCGKLVEIPGVDILDRLFWSGVYAAALAVVGVSAGLMLNGAWTPGLAVLGVGTAIGIAVWAIS